MLAGHGSAFDLKKYVYFCRCLRFSVREVEGAIHSSLSYHATALVFILRNFQVFPPLLKKKCERALWQSIVLNLSPSLCIDTQCAHNACCAICAAANTNRTMCLSCLLSLSRPVRPVYLLQPSSPVKSERRASANARVTGGRRRRKKKIKTRKTRSFPNASRSTLSYFTCSPPESPSIYPQAIFFVPVESRFS